MRGLLLKDFYMAIKYCRVYLFITVAFIIGSVAVKDMMFYVFYPCILAGMIPVTLLAYDERSRWLQYCGALPVTRAQIVSSKYLVGLFAQGAVVILSALARIIRMTMDGGFRMGEFLLLMSVLIAISCISSSACLPFMFKYGVEKGRMAYYIAIGIVCAASVIASGGFGDALSVTADIRVIMSIVCVAAVLLYALSWRLSVIFYRKRESL